MMKVDDIRKTLVEDFDYSEETVASMKKAELVQALELESVGFEKEDSTDENVEDSSVPKFGDIGWADYVMSLFDESELYEGKHPLLKGLRRVGTLLLGGVWESKVIKLEFAGDRAYCVYELRLGDDRIIHGAADAHKENIQGAYNVYPVAIAENRAEARAYRKALMIDVCTAEELSGSEKSYFGNMTVLGEYATKDNTPVSSGEYSDDALLSSEQMKIITAKTTQLGINTEKFLESLGYVEGKTTKKDGRDFIGVINEYQSNTNSIPEEIKQ